MKFPLRHCFMTGLALFLAVISIGCGSPEAQVDVAAQRQALKSANLDERINACVELAKVGPEAAPALQELLAVTEDADPTARKLAVYAIGQIGPAAKEAVPKLKALMAKEQDRDVMSATVNALRAIEPATVGDATMPNVSN